jgi:hypothetical protein
MSPRHSILVAALFVPGVALAQPTLDSLWPNHNGLRWEYTFTFTSASDPAFSGPAAMWLAGTVQTAGGTAQVLDAEHVQPAKAFASARPDPVLAAVWRARPDLRPAIAARALRGVDGTGLWLPLLLHDGYFMKNSSSIQMWQEEWDHPTWTYLTDELTVGAGFTQQLVPELASDVFLHGTVGAVGATVTTDIGTFDDALRMDYVVDYGWAEILDENQQIVVRARAETRGHVDYVPDVGPVNMVEDFFPYFEIDCAPAACPAEWSSLLGVSVETKSLSLAHELVAVTPATWGAVKTLYGR